MPDAPAIDPKQFRTVLGHFPTGVTIVTGLNEDQPAGFTIGSFTSVSLDPPMVGFLPMTNSITWEQIAPSERFCVNVLSRAQSDLCWKFAKAGNEDGFPLIGGSLIVDPNGEIAVEARTEEDELLVHPCDLDATVFGKETIFDFARHRRIEHYGLITSRTGAVPPPES